MNELNCTAYTRITILTITGIRLLIKLSCSFVVFEHASSFVRNSSRVSAITPASVWTLSFSSEKYNEFWIWGIFHRNVLIKVSDTHIYLIENSCPSWGYGQQCIFLFFCGLVTCTCASRHTLHISPVCKISVVLEMISDRNSNFLQHGKIFFLCVMNERILRFELRYWVHSQLSRDHHIILHVYYNVHLYSGIPY